MTLGDSQTPETTIRDDVNTDVGIVTPEAARRDSTRDAEAADTDGTDLAQPHTAGTDTPALDRAIEEIRGYRYNPNNNTPAQPAIKQQVTAMYMPMPEASTQVRPPLKTEAWKYSGQAPTPVTIGKARKLLADGYAAIDCDARGANVHGHAWMIEAPETWHGSGPHQTRSICRCRND